MPIGIYIRTKEHNIANSLSKKGLLKSENHKMNMSIGQTGTKKPWIAEKNKKQTDENHGGWKGEDARYRAKHMWVQKKLGKPHYCEHCKRSNLSHRSYHWANISKNYMRDVTDWIRLCVSCHKKYDKN